MSVHKTDTGWRFRTRINGKAYSRSGFVTKKEAQKQEVLFRDTFSGKTIQLSFDQLVAQYLSYCESHNKPTTVYDKRTMIDKHITPLFSKYRVKDISPKVILGWQSMMNKQSYSFHYKKKLFTTLTSLFNYAVQYQGLTVNPCAKVPRFKNNEVDVSFDFWTYEDYSKFIAAVDEPEWHAFFMTLYYTGLRKGEAQALTWNDFVNDELIINKTYAKKGNHSSFISPPKTKSSNRRVLLPDFLCKELLDHKENCSRVDGFSNKRYIFGIVSPFPNITITRRMEKYCELSGVKKIRIHDIRHSHASLLINNGADPTLVAERLGHKDVRMTLNIYSHMFPNRQIQIIKKLPF